MAARKDATPDRSEHAADEPLEDARGTPGGRMQTRGERAREGLLGSERQRDLEPPATTRADAPRQGPGPIGRREGEDTVEPIEPGGELGETREVGAHSSAARQPGRAPATKVVVHRPGEEPPEEAGEDAGAARVGDGPRRRR